MGKRRKGREIVLQSLYASLVSGQALAAAVDDQLERREPSDETAEFARHLADRISAHDRLTRNWLRELVQNWDPDRLGLVERAILQVALTELRYCPDVPWRVVINEACELARRFCDEEAVAFVNGILDRAAAEIRGETGPGDGSRKGPS